MDEDTAVSDGIAITSDSIEFNLRSGSEGCELDSVAHRANGAQFDFGRTPVWKAEFRNVAGYRTVLDSRNAGGFTYEVIDGAPSDDSVDDNESASTVVLRWSDVPLTFPDTGRKGTTTVTTSVRVPQSNSLPKWRLRIEMDASEVTLWRVSFPCFDDLERAGASRKDDRLLVPDGWGAYIEDPVHRDRLHVRNDQRYPSGSIAMGLLAFVNGGTGLYIGLHDPAGRLKDVDVSSDSHEETLSVRVDHYPEDMGRSQTEFELDYEIVLGTFEGDWYDAARIYREWATEETVWTRVGPVAEHEDVPEWFKRTALWFVPGWAEVVPWQNGDPVDGRDDIDGYATLLREIRERFDVPIGAHWYAWHQIPFDTGHPDYFPTWSGFAEAVQDLQEDNIHVMPYVNARVADPNSEAWSEQNLDRAVVHRASARYDPPTTAPRRGAPGVNEQWRSHMCGATEIWRASVRDTIRKLATDVGVDAVYLDVISAGPPRPCFAPDHGHPLGGGEYSVAGYRRLLSEIREWKQDEEVSLVLTSECNAEPYLDGLSGHLMWHSARADAVPLYSTVYGDYTFAFGRRFFQSDFNDSAVFRSKIAQLFSFGGQLGWIPLPVAKRLLSPEHESTANYAAGAARVLSTAWEYLLAGRRLRPPEPQLSIPIHELEWDMRNHGRWSVELPAVLVSTWYSPAREGIAVAATNWTETEQTGVWKANFEDAPAVDSIARTVAVSGEGGSIACRTDGTEATIELALPPGASRITELRSR